ncbi:Alcohol acetyltransferase [Metschnikowia aff. pulcherrima]|uniref:Alcohol acetyltransferase n=1 Tax=Metschnikowia aff. pulcherrima TaxID=2163413 RepID=A0A4P6XPE2_9ASCO|nr:Alcohol acetyltransferase [Metschnikowia aff. pulcherrima]
MSVALQDLTREPELMEKILLYCERNNIFKCISISVKINKPLEDGLVYGSLRALVLKYPLLFSFPVGAEPHVKYEPLEQILFKDVYEVNDEVTKLFKDNDAGNELLTSVSFYDAHKNKTVLWKLVYYRHTGWLTFHSSHCITDGGSVIAYLKEFVEGLNHAENVSEKEVLFSLKNDLPILTHGISPSLFEKVSYEPDILTKVASTVLKKVISWWPGIVPNVLEKQRHNLFFVDCPPVPFSAETCFESEHLISAKSPLNATRPMFINFETSTLDQILRVCRENNVKLLSYLIIVYAHTIHQLLPGIYDAKYLKVGIAVSFRNLFENLQSHGPYLGNAGRFDDGFYTYGVTYFLEPQLEFSWENVRKYHKFLHDTVVSEDWKKEYYVGCHTMEAQDYMGGRFEKKGDCCFLTTTNLGHIDVLDHEDANLFQIDDVLFAPSAGATMGTHHITVCSTKKGGVNIGFYNGDLRVKDWKVFKQKFASNLLRFLAIDSGVVAEDT